MSKIYIVTSGDYSDYRIIGASTSKEAAERIQKAFKADYLEEFDDAVAINPEFSAYRATISEEGFVQSVTPTENLYDMKSHFSYEGHLVTGVWARDVAHAAKIVNERRAQIIALGAWGKKTRLKEFSWSQCPDGPRVF